MSKRKSMPAPLDACNLVLLPLPPRGRLSPPEAVEWITNRYWGLSILAMYVGTMPAERDARMAGLLLSSDLHAMVIASFSAVANGIPAELFRTDPHPPDHEIAAFITLLVETFDVVQEVGSIELSPEEQQAAERAKAYLRAEADRRLAAVPLVTKQ